MKLTVLGKYGPYPKEDGGTSSYLITAQKTKILVDAGSGCVARLQKYCKLEELDGIVLSHLHYDHIAELLFLQYAKNKLKKDLLVYLPSTPENQYNTLCTAFKTACITDGLKDKIKSINLEFCNVAHSVEAYGIKLTSGNKTLVYTGDSIYLTKLEEFALNADVLLADSGVLGDVIGSVPHMSVKQAAQTAKNANVGKLILTHINPNYEEGDILAEAKGVFANSVIAKENKTYNIGT